MTKGVTAEVLHTKALATQLVSLIEEHDSLSWSVAWATENSVLPQLLKHGKKIRKVIIGTHFCQTSPTLLERLRPFPGARMMMSDGDTFHPKLYLFADTDGRHWAALIGSPNFTNGALSGNTELALLTRGSDQKAELFINLQAAVDEYWKLALPITADRLRAYTIQHRALANARRALAKRPPVRLQRPGAPHGDLLELSFADFAKDVAAERFYEQRIGILAAAREIFARRRDFSRMNADERKAIAGLGEQSNLFQGVTDWKLFGSMKGMGDFANRVADNDPKLSHALDAIPPMGDVTKDDYKRFVKHFRAAFKHSARTGGVATASRLLAMKRPDWFVCVDSKNARGLAADLGYAHSTLVLDDYWDSVIVPVTQSVWWQSGRPAGNHKVIWDGRCALLDAFYYVPSASYAARAP